MISEPSWWARECLKDLKPYMELVQVLSVLPIGLQGDSKDFMGRVVVVVGSESFEPVWDVLGVSGGESHPTVGFLLERARDSLRKFPDLPESVAFYDFVMYSMERVSKEFSLGRWV